MMIRTIWVFQGNQIHKYFTKNGKADIVVEPGTYCYDRDVGDWSIFQRHGALLLWEEVAADKVPGAIRAKALILT